MRKISTAVLLSLSLIACKKQHIDPPKGAEADVVITLHQASPGYTISPQFIGLSFETGILTGYPEYLNVNNKMLVQLFGNIGPGLLRIGGDTSDEIGWTGSARDGATAPDMLTTSDVDRLSAFSRLTGWPVLFGLNMANDDAKTAANEAMYVNNSLGSNLFAFQSGNEPDIYQSYKFRSAAYDANGYNSDWEKYRTSIISMVPNASFAGPDVAYNVSWVTTFAFSESSLVKLLDAHYYVEGPASDPQINYHDLLSTDYDLPGYINTLKTASVQHGVPYRITECNNIYGGGKAGTSDVFASALWALDFMWTVAENDGQGINFHGGQSYFYSPVTMANGVLTVHPEYYAMLAFKYGGSGGITIPLSMSNTKFNCSAYACLKQDKSYTITLINKEDTKDMSFNVPINSHSSTITVARLIAPTITSTTGVTFAGNAVQPDGTFKTGTVEHYPVDQNSFDINVPAGSVAIITVQ
ncbi:MAG TPA: glycosyl hydrolase family 79 C-terminal domain-containing protein [Mucilaginibacter sp.]